MTGTDMQSFTPLDGNRQQKYAMPRAIRFLLAASLLTALPAWAQTAPIMELNAGFHRIEAEVAADQAMRTQGLMQRRSMPANRGMLFVFTATDRHCMWMRNTLIPLSVAFLDPQGTILNIEEMKPETENTHCAAAPARFALEMNKGWFAAKGIKAGHRLGGLEKAPAPQ